MILLGLLGTPNGPLQTASHLTAGNFIVASVVLMRPGLLKGHLDALPLAVFEPGPPHGYAVIESLGSGSGGTRDCAHRHGLPGASPAGTCRVDRRCDWQTVVDAAAGLTTSLQPGRLRSASIVPCG